VTEPFRKVLLDTAVTQTAELEPPSVFELELELFRARDENDALRQEVERLRRANRPHVTNGLAEELERADARRAEAELDVERLGDENGRLCEEVSLVRKAHDRMAAAYESLSTEHLEAQGRLESAETAAATAEAEIAMARQIVAQLEEQCASYESRIATMQRQIAILATRVRATAK
jgi:chromosome segregation ATPase